MLPGRKLSKTHFRLTGPRSLFSRNIPAIQLEQQWNQPKDRHAVLNEELLEDIQEREYLTEEEALKFDPLTDTKNVVSMSQSTVKILGNTLLSFSFFLSVFALQPIIGIEKEKGRIASIKLLAQVFLLHGTYEYKMNLIYLLSFFLIDMRLRTWKTQILSLKTSKTLCRIIIHLDGPNRQIFRFLEMSVV